MSSPTEGPSATMSNSLGLDVHGSADSQAQVKSSDTTASPTEALEPGEDTREESVNAVQVDKAKKDKGKPYVPEAPPARAKMSPEELAERIEKIRLQNMKIKERREYVKADEEAFNVSLAAGRAKQAAKRKVQAQIIQNREQNAKRKLEKMGNREWDSGKQGAEWERSVAGKSKSSAPTSSKNARKQRVSNTTTDALQVTENDPATSPPRAITSNTEPSNDTSDTGAIGWETNDENTTGWGTSTSTPGWGTNDTDTVGWGPAAATGWGADSGTGDKQD